VIWECRLVFGGCDEVSSEVLAFVGVVLDAKGGTKCEPRMSVYILDNFRQRLSLGFRHLWNWRLSFRVVDMT
jgi:hypothetical protein